MKINWLNELSSFIYLILAYFCVYHIFVPVEINIHFQWLVAALVFYLMSQKFDK